MPDQWERYGKRYYAEGWESGPSRRQQRDAAAHDDPVRDRAPGKKDKNACKANHWGPHVPTYTLEKYSWSRKTCGWGTEFQHGQFIPVWDCYHTGTCVLCGKHLGDPPVCPARTKADITPPQWIVEEAQDKTAEYQVRRARWSPRRIIRGPSHYRKPKAR